MREIFCGAVNSAASERPQRLALEILVGRPDTVAVCQQATATIGRLTGRRALRHLGTNPSTGSAPEGFAVVAHRARRVAHFAPN